MTSTQQIVIGTNVYSSLYNRGRGIVYAIHGEQSPESVRVLAGVMHMGGRAEFDIVFAGGCESRRLPECILRGVQWRILDEVSTTEEIEALRGHAILVQQQKADEAEAKRLARLQRIAELKADPAYSHLEQGDDQYSGKLAAANIRRELKRAFPGIKFSVRKDHYGSVTITYPETFEQIDELKAITRKYQSASFDGMQDLEELNAGPWHVVFGGSKYVFQQKDWHPTA